MVWFPSSILFFQLRNSSLKFAAAMLLRAVVWCVWWPLSISSDAIADYCSCSCNNFDNAMPILGIQKVFVFTSWRLCGMRKCSLRKKLWKNRISVRTSSEVREEQWQNWSFFARGLFHSPLFTRRSDRTNDFGGGGLGRNQLSRLISKRIANAYTLTSACVEVNEETRRC